MSWCVFEFVVFICPLFFPPFSLTVTDSDGAQSSTQATLSVNKAVDYRPVANAGPNQVITLPRNSVTLHGNQSTDDHEPLAYEWSLSPESKGKVVEMQVRDEHQGELQFVRDHAQILLSNQGDSVFFIIIYFYFIFMIALSNCCLKVEILCFGTKKKGNSSLPS